MHDNTTTPTDAPTGVTVIEADPRAAKGLKVGDLFVCRFGCNVGHQLARVEQPSRDGLSLKARKFRARGMKWTAPMRIQGWEIKTSTRDVDRGFAGIFTLKFIQAALTFLPAEAKGAA